MFFRVIVPLLAIGLAVYAIADCASSEEDERGGVPKGLWFVLIIFLPLVGPVAWILVKRSQRTRYAAGGGYPQRPGMPSSGRGSAKRRRRGPVAPDDDPDFLWRLEQERRRQERAAGGGTSDDAAGGDGAPGERTSNGTTDADAADSTADTSDTASGASSESGEDDAGPASDDRRGPAGSDGSDPR
ncbi:PLD nuclease N-terminal domain-containing protein [Oerskovia flava]|uniref:PLD nuclease N-terminal domain-containing protein n=1 Tax=Oerskovia flava TaxID=2986422 RepID=UPI00223FECF4|nr:PLD nuclease N-terminal domain-containing protein [Oerskovia sp. JB1-3-2]